MESTLVSPFPVNRLIWLEYAPNSTLLEVLDEGKGEEQQNPKGIPQGEDDHGVQVMAKMVDVVDLITM